MAPEDMLAVVFKAILKKAKIDPKLIDDVVVGNVLPLGSGATTVAWPLSMLGILSL